MTAVTTDAYVQVDGIDLNNPGYNITMLDDFEAFLPMTKKGSNIVVASMDGEVFRPKLYAPATRTLHMWVCWKDEDGNSANSREERWGQFQANLDYLKSIFGETRSLRKITRQFFGLDGSLSTRFFNGELIDAVPMVFAENDFWPSAEFDLVLQSPDPFWYDDATITETIPLGTTTINVPGSIFTSNMTITLNGPLSEQILLTNNTNGAVLKYNADIGGGGFVTLDLVNFTTVDDSDNNVSGDVVHIGSRRFFQLDAGNNSITLDDTGGSGGTAELTYYPAWL